MSPFFIVEKMSHPLEQFKYCPACGREGFSIRNEKAKECPGCGFVYYFNPSASVACFVKNKDGQFLFVRRAKEPALGTLDLPGGFIDMYENAEEAVARELKEETGLQVLEICYLFSIPNIYPYMGFNVHTMDLFYETIVDTFDGLIASDDAAELVVLSPEEVNPDDFGLTSIHQAVRRMKEKK